MTPVSLSVSDLVILTSTSELKDVASTSYVITRMERVHALSDLSYHLYPAGVH